MTCGIACMIGPIASMTERIANIPRQIVSVIDALLFAISG